MSTAALDKSLSRSSNVSKLERLNSRVVKLLTAAVQEVLEAVRETVSEYQEKTARTQRENERLRLKLQDAMKKLEKEREAARLASISVSIDAPRPSSTEPQETPQARHVSYWKQDSVVKADAEPEAVCDLQVALTLPGTARTEQVDSSDFDHTSKGTECGTSCVDIKTEPVTSECSQQQQQQNHVVLPQVVVTMSEDLSDQTTRQDSFIGSGLYVQSNLGTLGRCVMNHVCEVCGKTFSRVANLRIHQRCHTGEKPYRCVVCGRCFSQAGDLKKHKRVHTGEKPYCCVQCGKSFSRGENLKRHHKVHVGDRIRRQNLWKGPHGLAV